MLESIKTHFIFVKMGSKIQFHDIGIIFDLIFRIVFQYFFLTFLWKYIFEYNIVSGWTFENYKIYLATSTLLSNLISYPNIYYISQDIKSGNIIYYLIKPVFYPLYLFLKNCGLVLSNLLIIVPIYVIYLLINNISLDLVTYFIFYY